MQWAVRWRAQRSGRTLLLPLRRVRRLHERRARGGAAGGRGRQRKSMSRDAPISAIVKRNAHLALLFGGICNGITASNRGCAITRRRRLFREDPPPPRPITVELNTGDPNREGGDKAWSSDGSQVIIPVWGHVQMTSVLRGEGGWPIF